MKAVEYYIKEQLDINGLGQYKEFVHFGLTSQDINNTAFPLMIRHGLDEIVIPALKKVLTDIKQKLKNIKVCLCWPEPMVNQHPHYLGQGNGSIL